MDINEILRAKGFRYNKQFGQNFITDTNLLAAITNDAGITCEDVVVEIGAGAGTLTRELATRAKKVIAFEIDKNLEAIHKETLSEFSNVELIYGDFMKFDIKKLTELAGGKYKVVANLPYYITSPIIMSLLDDDLDNVLSITVMVQKEFAERITSKENTAEYGAITCSLNIRADATILRQVSRKLFYPVPAVDSALLHIVTNPKKYDVDLKKIIPFMRSAFAMRRKTLVNNISAAYPITKDAVGAALIAMNLPVAIRGEVLAIPQFIQLHKLLFA